MASLYQHALCPHSRFVRLALGELGATVDLVEEAPWERREAFLHLNPAGTTPVFIDTDGPPVPEAWIIAEYLDETRGLALGERRLLPEPPGARVEVRRLTGWFHTKFFEEVSGPLTFEKVVKRRLPSHQGGGGPDTGIIRAAKANIRYHLQYIGWLARTRDWLAGETMTYADLAAAAHLSVVDFLGDVPWDEDEHARNWYARIKSRPAFRPLLTDAVRGMVPAQSYADLDF
jgi:glutathione S-transferase